MSSRHHFYNLFYAVALFLSATVVVACGENKDNLVNLGDGKDIISTEVHDLDVVYTEYGNTKTLLKAPLLQRYMFLEEPYSIFPKGFFVQLFDADSQLESQITADYALYKEKPVELWQAVGNVVVINFQKQQTLTTDTLYWNRPTKSIYTYSPVRIETTDGLIQGRNGMTSDEHFSTYEIRNVGDSSYYYFENKNVADSVAVESPQESVQQPIINETIPSAVQKPPVNTKEAPQPVRQQLSPASRERQELPDNSLLRRNMERPPQRNNRVDKIDKTNQIDN